MLEFIGSIIEVFAEIALDIQEFFFRRKREKRRAYERENNLPPKKMRSPYERFYILAGVFVFILLIIRLVTYIFRSGGDIKLAKTEEKIIEIKALLEKEREVFGKYPEALKTIKRNNPLRNDLLVDGWGTTFSYKVVENSYILVSAGSDKKINTEDDLIYN